MTQKDKLRESFLALVSIKSTANNIIDYCSEATNYAQEIKHKCEEVKIMGNNRKRLIYNMAKKISDAYMTY